MEEELQQIGLSKNESKVYLALAELGQTTIVNIAKKSKIHRSNIYDAIDNLIKKGLVSYAIKNKSKYFQITSPDNFRAMIKEKESIVNSLLPQLKLLETSANRDCDVQILTGVRAAKQILDGFLKYDGPILVFGVPSAVGKIMGPFLSNFHKRRIEKKILMKHIYNTDAFDRISFLKSLPYTPVRILPAEYNSPVATNVVADEVILIYWIDDPVIVQIKNKPMAEAYRKYFELLWKKAKPA